MRRIMSLAMHDGPGGIVVPGIGPARIGIKLQNNQTTLHDTTISIKCQAGGVLTIYWGDGTASAVTCNNVLNAYTHTYTVQARYTILVVGTTRLIVDFRCASQAWLGGDISGVVNAFGAALTTLSMHSCPTMTGDMAVVAAMPALRYLYLQNNTLLTYLASATLPPCAGGELRLDSTGLAAAEVDRWLIDLADGVGAGPATLNIAGTNAARTAASNAAKAALVVAGWTVTVNE